MPVVSTSPASAGPEDDAPAPALPDESGTPNRLHGMSLVALGVGLILTVVLASATRTGYSRNESRLLVERTKQAAAVLTAAIPGIQTPLASAAEVAEQGDGDDAAFRRLMSPLVGPGRVFASASLWRIDDPAAGPVVVVGEASKLSSQPAPEVQAFLERSVRTRGLVVLGLLDGDEPRLGYSYTSEAGTIRYVAYAEAALPARRTSVVPADSAFAGLDNAVYLGNTESEDSLLTASTSRLPLKGRRAAESVTFGDTSLLLVMSPTTELSGSLLARLPWLVGGVGALSTIAATAMVELLVRRRDRANALAAQNEELYANQLSVSLALQRSLLPRQLPNIGGLELAARYMPGVAGLDIGGDWYDVIELDHDRVMLVVGDVSGRGVEAGTIMASLRYSIRAFASRDDDPATILDGLSRLLDLGRDGHFATVSCAVIDVADHSITLANAGHPPPLLLEPGNATFLPVTLGPPIGVTLTQPYTTTTHRLPPASTVVMFTDGLFERRGEPVTEGLERLRTSVRTEQAGVEQLLDDMLDRHLTPDSHDDTAILGVTWTTKQTT